MTIVGCLAYRVLTVNVCNW